ncbi:hypothetical protein CMQ_7172 [Grosmannia clavigera kw1407]|uniref:Uncharacterized protein n=1 Tax=Grosmannia clavigera (strain kw1407 / UAMH 11150) TaxID=655863 RepID=F0XPD4_GROCL|nr:uncharacterized protein CMQ_7172 [Grosmannia clavigera kw1407]EFX00170.1 hypothetical protein CMQ_7172 [Grosmannia clavigera kw1407]
MEDMRNRVQTFDRVNKTSRQYKKIGNGVLMGNKEDERGGGIENGKKRKMGKEGSKMVPGIEPSLMIVGMDPDGQNGLTRPEKQNDEQGGGRGRKTKDGPSIALGRGGWHRWDAQSLHYGKGLARYMCVRQIGSRRLETGGWEEPGETRRPEEPGRNWLQGTAPDEEGLLAEAALLPARFASQTRGRMKADVPGPRQVLHGA